MNNFEKKAREIEKEMGKITAPIFEGEPNKKK